MKIAALAIGLAVVASQALAADAPAAAPQPSVDQYQAVIQSLHEQAQADRAQITQLRAQIILMQKAAQKPAPADTPKEDAK